jgi:hypothetical protein
MSEIAGSHPVWVSMSLMAISGVSHSIHEFALSYTPEMKRAVRSRHKVYEVVTYTSYSRRGPEVSLA